MQRNKQLRSQWVAAISRVKAWLLSPLLLFYPLTLAASQNMVLVNAVVYQHPKANSVVTLTMTQGEIVFQWTDQ